MLLDETCFFLAADFDKSNWEEDARAFLKTCHQLNLPAALERSRSGKGAHVWLFFTEAIPAILARKLGCHILTETMEHRPDADIRPHILPIATNVRQKYCRGLSLSRPC